MTALRDRFARLQPGTGGFLTWWGKSLAAWLPVRWRAALGFGRDRLLLADAVDALQLRLESDDGVRGPIVQPATAPLYFDITLDANAAWDYALPEGHNAFAYVFEGDAAVGAGEEARPLDSQELAVLGGGEVFAVRAGAKGARLILVAGRPLREPVARYGPFVMNTKEEIMQAFVDFQEGKF